MIGHGRPATMALALARAAAVLCACFAFSAAAQNTPPPAEPVQLRITWGGGDAGRWLGRIAVDDGTLSNLTLLETDADAPGSIWLDAGQLRVASLSAHKLDSIELAAQSSATAKLQIELAPADKGPGQRLEVPLADLARHPYQTRLDDRGDTLEIQVVPPTLLKIAPNRDPLIFAPGEQCTFELATAIPNLAPGTGLDIQTTVTPASPAHRKENLPADNQHWSVPVDGHPKGMLNVQLPQVEGVYTIRVVASRPSGYVRVWSASTRLAERSFQVVVLDPHPAASVAAARWDSVLEIDPTNPRWIERLPSWTQVGRIPGFNHGPLGSLHASAVDLPLGRFIELPFTAPGADPHWQAYSLPLESVGVPHMLEIDYPADAEQQFAISIVEPNAGGLIAGTNRDAGVYVEGFGRSEAKQKQTHRLVFWPRTQAPLLVVTNLHPNAAAHFGQIRVFKRSSNQLSAGLPVNLLAHDRLIAAYLARPTAAETFGATQSVNPALATSGLAAISSADSQTTYESATRLADYLRYSGYNSAIVNIPLTGRVGSAAAKSLDIDNIELMLRVFDREGLSLLPAIEFNAPLPQLEVLRRNSDPRASGLEWVAADGRTWLETYGTRHGLAPYYNLLDPRVQQVILKLAQDLTARFGQHRAFAGLAIQLSSDGFAQLPTPDWGLDDATFARFGRDTGIQLVDAGDKRFAARRALIVGKHAEAWRSWRAAQVSAFYAQLASVIAGNTDRKLILTTENVFSHPQLAARMRPNLLAESAENRAASAMLDAGLDRQALEHAPNLVLCPTRYVESMASLPDRALDLELNDAFNLWRQQSTPAQSRAAVLYHRPTRQRLASFEVARTPWRVAGDMQLVCQPLAQGAAVRQPYLEALAENDPAVLIDGGELLPLGHEDTLRDLRSTLSQLPIGAATSEITRQPVVVRTYTEAGRATFVAMNMSAWHCEVQIALDIPQPATLEPLVSSASNDLSAPKPQPLSAGRQSWPIALAPYEVLAVRIAEPGAKVVDVQVNVGEAANSEIAAKLTDLNNRDLTFPPVYQALSNPSFELLPGAGRLPGWHLVTSDPRTTAELVTDNPQDGKSCLHLRCEEQIAKIESDNFPAPSTGQFAMTVYARAQNLAPNTELRLVVETDIDGEIYCRAARVSGAELQQPGRQWGGAVAILVDDLPLQSHGQIMRVSFQLTGPGEVWLDNVKLYNLLFPLNFHSNAQAELFQLSKQIRAAKGAYDTRQINDSVRILDGYWPRFIIANRPPVQPKNADGDAVATRPASPPQPNETQEAAPGFGNRFKRLVPILR